MTQPTASRRWPLLLPILVGLIVRLAVVVAFPDMSLTGDEPDFLLAAREAVAGDEVSKFPFRPPLYIGFSAAVLAVFGDSANAIRVAQILIELLTILGLYRLGRYAFGERAGLIAAWIAALYPDYILFSHSIWSETISLTLLVWALWFLVRLREQPSLGGALWLGVLWGALCLVKPHHVYMLPVMLAWVVYARGGAERALAGRLSAVVLLVTAIGIAPWSIFVSVREDKPILICTTGPKNLRSGVNFTPPPQFDFATKWRVTGADHKLAERKRETGVVAFILEHPGLFTRRAWQKMSYLWSPNSYFIRFLYEWFPGHQPRYGDPQEMAPAVRLGSVYATLGVNMLLCLGLVVGLFFTGFNFLSGLAALYTLSYMAMITLTPALSRYRLPLMLFAIVYSAAVLAGRADLRFERRPWLAFGAASCLAALVALWALRLPDILDQAW